MTVSQQIEKIKNLKFKPDFLINIKVMSPYPPNQNFQGRYNIVLAVQWRCGLLLIIPCQCSDYDLCERISGQRQHPDSGQVYQRNQWDPNVIVKHKKEKDQQENESEEEEQDEEEEQEEEEVNIANF